MLTQLKITITKDIIRHCKNCGRQNEEDEIGKNCAIALAIKDIFPNVYITNYYILPFGIRHENDNTLKIQLPVIAQQFIKLFDGFYLTPNLRLLLPEFEFDIDIPDAVIEQINIDEIRGLNQETENKYLIPECSLKG